VNHDILMSRVARRVSDKRVLKRIRGCLTAGMLADGLVGPREEGTPQGGPLSPLLSNLLLDEWDKELEARGHRFVRYADDNNLYVRSERAGQRVLASVTEWLSRRLRLKVNASKSGVARPSASKFLGFSFTGGKEPKRRIAPKALKRFKGRVRELTRRTRGVSLDHMVGDLRKHLVGWRSYCGFCQTPSVLESLDGWIRRRLRCFQWKRGTVRFRELRARGLSRDHAAMAAAVHAPWPASRGPGLQTALPKPYLASLGLPTLAPSR
jgi:RNA-directed DNA polymerase